MKSGLRRQKFEPPRPLCGGETLIDGRIGELVPAALAQGKAYVDDRERVQKLIFAEETQVERPCPR